MRLSLRRSLSLAGLALLSGAAPSNPPAGTAVDPSLSNRQQLESLSPQDRLQLRHKQEMFLALAPVEQDRLRSLDRDLHRQPNAEALLITLREYVDWLSSLDAQEKWRLAAMEPAQRVVEIQQLRAIQRQREFGLTGETRLPREDFDALRAWAEELSTRRRNELLEIFQGGNRGGGGGSSGSTGRRGFAPGLLFIAAAMDRGRVSDEVIARIFTEQDLKTLQTQLSAAGATILAGVGDHSEQTRLVIRWLASMVAGPQIPREQLREFFENELSPQQQVYIEQLGPRQGQEELLRLYFEAMRRRGPRSMEQPDSSRPTPPDSERPPPGRDPPSRSDRSSD